LGLVLRPLLRCEISRAPVVAALLLLLLFSAGLFLLLFVGGIAVVGVTRGQKCLRLLSVEVGALRLKIGVMRSSDLRPLVPGEAEPGKGFKNVL